MADPKCCDWVSSEGGQHPKFGVHAGIDGGNKLYVIRAHHEGAVVPGKLHMGHTHAYIAYDMKEVPVFNYEVIILISIFPLWIYLSPMCTC